MGRFSHEAMMVDPRTSIVYETEDAPDAGFYRFVPHVARRLKEGGELFMLRTKSRANVDMGLSWRVGTSWETGWVRIDDPKAVTRTTYVQGAARGGARFSRLEGCWWGSGKGYFVSTNGGSAGRGQIFEYDPVNETLTLVYDSPNASAADNPDNLTVTPRGGLLLCEDPTGLPIRTASTRLIGLTLDGATFPFAANDIVLAKARNSGIAAGDYRQSEWAGACYSPDGQWLFVNVYSPGVTFAITGPWGKGPL
jgi:uncharacterized repeat protein (TIGR03803 family)